MLGGVAAPMERRSSAEGSAVGDLHPYDACPRSHCRQLRLGHAADLQVRWGCRFPGTIEGGLSVPFVVNHESCSRIEKVNLLSNGQAKDHVLADLPPLSCIGLVQPPFERWSGGSAKEFVFTSGGKATVTLATPLTFETESPPDFCIWESKEKISGGYEAGVARAVGQMLMKLNHHRSSASCAPGTTKTPFALELTRESSVLEAEKG